MTWASPTKATDQERRRKARNVLEDGEFARFDLRLMDGAPRESGAVDDYGQLPTEQREAAQAYDAMVRDLTERSNAHDANAASIDEELREEIKAAAKAAGKKPEDWLAEQTDRDLERMVESAAKRTVASFRAATIAGALGLDHAAADADPVASAYDRMVADLTR